MPPNAAQQGSSTISTGITEDKEAAGDTAIELAVLLSGFTQAYALENENMSLYEQMRINHSQLDNLADETLAQRLHNLHQRMFAVDQPLEEFGVTSAKLAELLTKTQHFESMKSAPRLAITGRKGHNATVPGILRNIRGAFTILDKLIKNWEAASPVFVRDYFNARQIVDPGSHSGGEELPPAKTDA